jgi:hypothetical protein
MKRLKQGMTVTQAVQQMQQDLEYLHHMIDTIIRTQERTNETTTALNNRLAELERSYRALIKRRRPGV